jgi:rod shape-determining protein MreC
MRNVFLFIRRYFTFLIFLVLQILSLTFLFSYNKFHEAAFMGVAGEVTGRVNEKYNNVEYYFKLKKTNEGLVQENNYLRTLLKETYEWPDSSSTIVLDSIRVDSLLRYQRFRYYPAKVVGSFASTQTNYLTIHRGSLQGIKKDMGVISASGIVGRVVDVSNNYATVMSALSRQFKVKAKLKKTGENGTIEWDGVSASYLLMRDIPNSAKLAKGDTVLTSELSSIYPPNILVGTVEEVYKEQSSNFFTIRLKTATNFYNVQYVNVIEDMQKEERLTLEMTTKNAHE